MKIKGEIKVNIVNFIEKNVMFAGKRVEIRKYNEL